MNVEAALSLALRAGVSSRTGSSSLPRFLVREVVPGGAYTFMAWAIL